jgi:uncharacterized protein YrrD
MLRSIEDLYGFAVEGTDGQIGRVQDAYFDDRAWAIRFLVVETGPWLEGRKVLISPVAIGNLDWTRRLLTASITREKVRRSPDIDTKKPVSRQHEAEQYGYYGYPYYWGGSGLWGDGMQPAKMLGVYGGRDSATQHQKEMAFVGAQAKLHRQRGDDPHLRSCDAIIRYHVRAIDGGVGHVEGLIVDDQTWAVRYFVVNTSDWWLGHQVLVAPQWIEDISWLEATVSVDLSRQAVKHAPAYDADAPPDREQEQRTYEHYARPGYWVDSEQREIELSRP